MRLGRRGGCVAIATNVMSVGMLPQTIRHFHWVVQMWVLVVTACCQVKVQRLIHVHLMHHNAQNDVMAGVRFRRFVVRYLRVL